MTIGALAVGTAELSVEAYAPPALNIVDTLIRTTRLFLMVFVIAGVPFSMQVS
jgi:hypothetical protein